MTNASTKLDLKSPRAAGAGELPPMPRLRPSRTRSQLRRLRLLALIGGGTWLAALLLKTGMRPDHPELPWVYAYGLPAVMYAAGAGMLALALAAGRQGIGAQSRWMRVAVVALPVLFGVSSLWTEIGVHSVVPVSFAAAWSAHAACGVMTLVLGAGPFFAALLVLRHAFPSRFIARGALVGLCCGLAAAATIHMHCPVAMTSHILVSHGMPLLALTALGATLATRFFRT